MKRFKQLQDVTKSQIGKSIVDDYAERQDDYKLLSDDDAKKENKNKEYNKWMAYLLLRGSDQNKYGSMVKGLAQQFSLGNDQYPKTIIAATDVLSTHKIDQKYFDNQKKAKENAVKRKHRKQVSTR